MSFEIKHLFQSAKGDGPDPTRVQPSNWNEAHDVTMASGKVLGRSTAGAGAVEELTASSAGLAMLAAADAAAQAALLSSALGLSLKADKATTVTGGGIATGGGDLSTNRVITVPKATATEFRSNGAADKALTTDVWAAAAYVDAGSVSGTLAFDFNTFINLKMAMTGNVLFGATSNLKVGQQGLIRCAHSGGTRTISLNNLYWKTTRGEVLVLSGVNGSKEFLFYFVDDDGLVFLSLASDVKAGA